MASYQLSLEAENDIDDILTYGVLKFGLDAAFAYQDALKNHFTYISQNPLHHMKVDHISPGSRRSVFRAHSIYFSQVENFIFVERIIGQQIYQI